MRIIYIVCMLLLTTGNNASAQKRLQITPYINYAVPLGELAVEEDGLGLFEFEYQEKPMLEYGVQIGKILKNPKWDVGVTLSYKVFETRYSYETYWPLTDPVQPFVQVSDEYLIYDWFGLGLYGSYQINEKWRVSLIYEINDPIMGVEKSSRTNFGAIGLNLIYIDDEPTLQSLGYSEWIAPSDDPYDYGFPELKVNYNPWKDLSISAGIKYKPYRNNYNNYNLKITGGNNYGEILGTTNLNDTHIYNKFLFIYAGVNYRFELFERKKSKAKKRKK